MERQNHGFVFEKEMIEKYHIIPSETYTSVWDGTLNNIPVSIKLEQRGSDIELADFRRNALNQNDFYLIVGFWDKDKTNIIETHILFIPGQKWHNLFPTHFIDDFSEMLHNITNDKEDDKKWKEMIKTQKARWQKETNNLIRPRFKRDHKSQKRVQCAINNRDFYKYFIPTYGVELN